MTLVPIEKRLLRLGAAGALYASSGRRLYVLERDDPERIIDPDDVEATENIVDVYDNYLGSGDPVEQPLISDASGGFPYWVESGPLDFYSPDDTTTQIQSWTAGVGEPGPQGPVGAATLDIATILDYEGVDPTGATYSDDAFAAAIADVTGVEDPTFPDADSNRGRRILVPPGVYKTAEPIVLDKAVILEGSSGAGWFANTFIRPDSGVTGIIVESHDPVDTQSRGDWSVIRDIALRPAGTSGTADGVQLLGRAQLQGMWISQFGRDGVHIEANNPDSNANLSYLERVFLEENGRHGVYASGVDANACSFINCNASNNDGDGFHEASFLGNTYVACHTASNGGRGFHKPASQAVNRSVRVGCYTESGQGDIDLWTGPATSVGDVTENHVIGEGSILVSRGTSGMWESSPIHIRLADATDADTYLELGLPPGDPDEAHVFAMKMGTDGGIYYLSKSTDVVRYTLDGSAGQVPLQFTLADHADPGMAQFPFGFYQGSGAGAPRWLSDNGSPEGAVTAEVGSLYTQKNGGVGTTLWVKESGSGNTGWDSK